jgi:hypothetical protein
MGRQILLLLFRKTNPVTEIQKVMMRPDSREPGTVAPPCFFMQTPAGIIYVVNYPMFRK